MRIERGRQEALREISVVCGGAKLDILSVIHPGHLQSKDGLSY